MGCHYFQDSILQKIELQLPIARRQSICRGMSGAKPAMGQTQGDGMYIYVGILLEGFEGFP